MAKYRVQDGHYGEDFEAADDDAALAYAEEWLRTGDYDRRETLWLDAEVIQLAEDGSYGETLGPVSVTLEPDVPPCRGGEHVWCSPHHILGGLEENPGVWGHGGGARIKEVCSECGLYKLIDTWATNPSDGTQGHTSVEYFPADAESLEWVEQLNQPREVSNG